MSKVYTVWHIIALDKDHDNRSTLLGSSGIEELANDYKKEFENDDRWSNVRIEKEDNIRCGARYV